MTKSLYDIPVVTIDGRPSSLAGYKNHVLLIVNVASKCGLTKQYEGLESLYERYRDQGFVIAGFPSNDFAGQEPGTEAEIAAFCTSTFGVKFPLFEKVTVVGPQKHPLYQALIEAQSHAETTAAAEIPFREKLKGYGMTPNPEPEVLWNFEKFLVSRDGAVVRRFTPDTTPDDPALVSAVTAELAR